MSRGFLWRKIRKAAVQSLRKMCGVSLGWGWHQVRKASPEGATGPLGSAGRSLETSGRVMLRDVGSMPVSGMSSWTVVGRADVSGIILRKRKMRNG